MMSQATSSPAMLAPAHQMADPYRLLVDAVTDRALFMLDPAGLIASWNSGGEWLTGYNAEEIIGQPFSLFFPNANGTTDEAQQLLQQAIAEGRCEDEGKRLRKDGILFSAVTRVTPLFDSAKSHLGFAVVMQVGSEQRRHELAAQMRSFALDNFVREDARRQAEQRLRDEQQFADTMIESMPGIVYLYDDNLRFLRWNRNFETVSGYSAAEIAVMRPVDFFQGEDKVRIEQGIAEVFATGESSLEASFVAKHGVATPYFFTGRRVRLGDKLCLVGVGIDITERRRAEARVRESEARLIEAQRIARVGSWELDIRQNTLTWSDQIFEIFEIDKAEFTGAFETFLEFVHPDDRERLEAAQQAALTGRAQLDIEHRIVLWDGSEKVVHELGALKRDDHGLPSVLAGTVHDITDRARIEAERKQRHHAEAADRVKSAFLATMSHEFRTPLNSIIGFTGIVLQGLAGPLNAEQTSQLGMVRTSARHLLALVNDVLDISKIEAGQFEVIREPFDLRQSIEKVLALVGPQAQATGLALRSRLAPDLGEAVSDERRFEQILLNLLSNALKFTDQGEVTLTAELVEGFNPPGTEREQPAVLVRISDTGIGIKAEDLPTLFEPFRQLDSSLSRAHEGTGLGLAICRRLVTLMGGEIQVESEWGKGSTFSVVLPVQPMGS
jgi:PAS domain S-box-containing protein